jgi:hypothetical protein
MRTIAAVLILASACVAAGADQPATPAIDQAPALARTVRPAGPHTLVIPVGLGTTPRSGQAFANLGNGSVVGVGGPLAWVTPIPLEAGAQIVEARARVVDSIGPTPITMELRDASGATLAVATSLGDGTLQDLSLTGLTSRVVDDHMHAYSLYFSSYVNSANVTAVLDAAIDYNSP